MKPPEVKEGAEALEKVLIQYDDQKPLLKMLIGMMMRRLTPQAFKEDVLASVEAIRPYFEEVREGEGPRATRIH